MNAGRGGALSPILAAALLLVGCGGVPGTPSPGPPVDRGPFTELRADLDLAELAGADYLSDVHVAGFGRGGAHVVVRDHGAPGGTLVTLPPGGDGTGAVETAEFGRQIEYIDDLHATRDGRLVVVGQVYPPDSDEVMFGVAVLDPETDSGPAYDLLEDGYRDAVESVVSPDGSTLFALVALDVGDDDVIRVLAVDLSGGAITASLDLEEVPGESRWPAGIALAPDGTLVVELDVSVESVTDEDLGYAELRRFGSDLSPQGDAVPLSDPADDFDGEGLGITADGTVIAVLWDFDARLVRLSPGSDQPEVVVDEGDMLDLAVDPAGHWAYAIGEDGNPVPIDLTTGEIGEPIPFCDADSSGGIGDLLPGGGGRTLLVEGSCDDASADVWVLGPAAQ